MWACFEKVNLRRGIIKQRGSETWKHFAYYRKLLRPTRLRAVHNMMCVVEI